MSPLTKGYLIAIIGIVIWSTTGILIGYLMTTYQMPPLQLALWRNLFVTSALLLALALTRRTLLQLAPLQLRFYLLYGLVLALFNAIWTTSVQSNGAAVATVLGYSSAAFTALFAWRIFSERLGVFKIIAVILSLVGCVLVSNAYDPAMWNLNPLGIVTGLSSGVLFAVYNLMGKEAARRKLNTWTSLLYSFAFGSLFILLFNLLPVVLGQAGLATTLVPALPLNGWLVLIFLAVIPTLLGFGLYNTSMKYLPASVASLLATTEPAMTAVEAYLFLDERLTVVQIVGSFIILSGVIVMRFEKE